MKRIDTLPVSPPVRPNNGKDAIELLRQNKWIEVNNEVVFWFIEQLQKKTDFTFCCHFNQHNNNWTTLNKLE